MVVAAAATLASGGAGGAAYDAGDGADAGGTSDDSLWEVNGESDDETCAGSDSGAHRGADVVDDEGDARLRVWNGTDRDTSRAVARNPTGRQRRPWHAGGSVRRAGRQTR